MCRAPDAPSPPPLPHQPPTTAHMYAPHDLFSTSVHPCSPLVCAAPHLQVPIAASLTSDTGPRSSPEPRYPLAGQASGEDCLQAPLAEQQAAGQASGEDGLQAQLAGLQAAGQPLLCAPPCLMQILEAEVNSGSGVNLHPGPNLDLEGQLAETQVGLLRAR